MTRPPNILYILLPLFSVTGALRVTMRTLDVSVLRDEDVTIHCDIYDLNTLSAIGVLWSRTSENGTESDVYEYNDGQVTISRPGCSMEKTEIQKGNAALYIPRVQFSDEGEYSCTVTNNRVKVIGRVTLKVSVPLSAEVTPADPTIELGTERTILCEVHNFYPKDVSMRWVLYRKGSSNSETPDIWTCMKKLLNNIDGTYNVTSLLILNPKKEDNGNTYSCIINHRSLPTDLSRNVTITVTEKEDNSGAVITAVVVTLLTTIFLCLSGFFYVRFIKKDPPTLSEITGNDELIDMNRTTLTCQIMDFKPNDIEVSVCMRRSGEEEMRTIYTWRSGGHITPVRIIRDDGGGGEDFVDMEEGRQLMNGSAGHEDKPLHLEMDPQISKKNLGKFICQCSLHITPSYNLDNGAELSVHVKHPALTSPASVHRILKVIGVVPVLDSILKGQEVVCVGEKLDLSCRIHSFYPRDIQVTWYTEDDIIIPSHTSDPLPDNDELYHVNSTSSYTPTMKNLGKKFRCQVHHGSLSRPKPVIWTLEEILSPPTLGDIQCDPPQPQPGQPVTFSCTIRDMYPGDPGIEWTWSARELSDRGWKVKIQKDRESRVFSGTTELTLTPDTKDHSSEISLEVKHCGKSFTKKTLINFKGRLVLSEISSDPGSPDYGRPVTLRCDVIGCDPGQTPEVTWSAGGRDLGKGETRGSGDVLSCSLTITPTAQDYGKIYTCRVTQRDMQPITKESCLRLPEKPPTLSDIVVRPTRVTANQEASFTVTMSGYSPRDLQIKWYKEFCTFPQSEVTISDPEIGLDGLYKSSSTLTFTPKMSDDNTSIRCEVTHSQSKNVREKRYTLHLTGDSNKAEKSPKTEPEKKFQIREIKCVTEHPRVGDEVTLVAYIEECREGSAEITWYAGMFPINGEIENRQDGTDCTSTITFTPEDSDKDCPIKLEVFYNYQTVEESFTLPLV